MENITKFLNTKYENNIEFADHYAKIAKNLLYQDPEIIVSVTEKLKKNILDFALKNTQIYRDHTEDKIYSRKDLLNKSKWETEFLKEESKIMRTSGSTSGEPFSYSIYKKYYNFIEDENQYGLILEEFDISKKHIDILILANLRYNPVMGPEQFYLMQEGKTFWSMHSHRAEASTRYFVNFSTYKDTEAWYKKLFELLNKKFFDVILTTGSIVNLLRHYIIKFNYNKKICKLLNQTTEFLIKEDIEFLKENNYIDNYCDSMRCWDGGATFFTCKYNNYHLMDNLSWVDSKENKLISTDYFSFSAPFINYWNGDLCEIENNYKQCMCLRHYRPFKMLESRPFGLKGTAKITDIKQKINKLKFSQNLLNINFNNFDVIITTNRELAVEEKQEVIKILKDYKCKFIYI